MEKYLTPVQYQQYQLHQQVEATTQGVEMAFIVFALCVVVGLITALIVNMIQAHDKQKLESAKRTVHRRTLSRRIEREINNYERAKLFRETREDNDHIHAKTFGSAR